MPAMNPPVVRSSWWPLIAKMRPTTMNTTASTPSAMARGLRFDAELPGLDTEDTIPPSTGHAMWAGLAVPGRADPQPTRRNLSPNRPAGVQEVPDDILSEMFGARFEHPAAVPFRHVVHEPAQTGVVGEQEDVEGGVPAGHLVHLGQGELEGLRGGRVVESRAPVALQVRGRLAIGNHDDHRLVLRMPVNVPPGQHQRVLQVGALHHLPAQAGQFGLADLARVVGEADDLDRVLRVLAPQQ